MKARVQVLPPKEQRHGCWANEAGQIGIKYGSAEAVKPVPAGSGSSTSALAVSASRPAHSKPEVQDLGLTTIQGVEAHGQRFTYTTPTGEIGNDRPLVRTQEVWRATDFNLLLREITDDPRIGATTKELVNLSLSEPEMTTFQPPDGYEVVTEQLHEVPCQMQ